MQKPGIIALNQSTIQYGKLNSINYVEKHSHFYEHRMLYYQTHAYMQSMNLRQFSFREVVNTHVPLIDTSKECGKFCNHIANQNTFEERIAYIEQAVLPRAIQNGKLIDNQLINQSLECIYRFGEGISMEELSSQVGYSAR